MGMLTRRYFSFQGANPGTLLNMEHDEEIFLKQSFRVPKIPGDMARMIIHRNNARYR